MSFAAPPISAFGLANQESTLHQSLVRKLLPSDAKIIEIVDLQAAAGKRAFVLWMISPKWSQLKNDNHGKCSDIIHGNFGHYWEGPTRLSLVNLIDVRLINTIEIR